MATDDFVRTRLQTMIDLRHPLAVLSARLPWAAIEAALAAKFGHEDRPPKSAAVDDLFGATSLEFGGGIGRAG